MGQGFVKYLFYVLSLFVLPGLIVGTILYTRSQPEYKRIGANCLLITFFSFAFFCTNSIMTGLGTTLTGDKLVPYLSQTDKLTLF